MIHSIKFKDIGDVAIIARLIRKPNVNFIEPTPDYLNTKKKFIEENA